MGNSIFVLLLSCAACTGGDDSQASARSQGDAGESSGALGAHTGAGGSGATGVGHRSGAGAVSGSGSGSTGPPDASGSGSSGAGDPDASAVGSAHSVDGGPSAGCGKSGQAGEHLLSLSVGGTMRTYDLILPAGYTGSTPQPVYFVFHGRDADHTAVTPYGVQDNAIGVFPDGLNRNGVIGWDTSVNGTDVAMFDAVLQSVEANYCADLGRVYATGFSFGASMANALGCFRSNVLKAFASVEGGILFGNGANDCKGPIPGWINQYKQDPTVSYATGLKAEQFFLSLDSASNPQPYDTPNPCVINTGKAPLVWCTPPDALHAWPPYATAAIKRFFSTL